MDSMEYLVLIFSVIPALVTSITISPNGNSPEIKMIGGMMVDVEKGFMPMTMTTKPIEPNENVSIYKKSRQLNPNGSPLSINERYRRLIPYMTFYYANDLAAPTTEPYTKDVEVEKAEIVEATSLDRHPKKIIHSSYRNVPRYQGNRLTQHNIASAYPTKTYKDVPVPVRVHTPHYNNYLSEHNGEGHDFRRVVYKPNKLPSVPFASVTRKPFVNHYQNEEPGFRYYTANKDQPKYKLVPYEQTPPVKVTQNEDLYEFQHRPLQEQVYVKPRPIRPQYSYDNVFIQPPARRPSTIVSESYYEKQRPQHQEIDNPVIESGFKPILGSPVTSEAPLYSSTIPEPVQNYDAGKHQVQIVETPEEVQKYQDVPTPLNHRPNYYPYAVDPLAYQSPVTNKLSLGDLLNSLQLNKSIPKPITKENVGTSIRTLLQVLDYLKASPQNNDVEPAVMSTPAPFVAPKVIVTPAPPKQVVIPTTPIAEVEFQQEPYLTPINPPSQHIDDYTPGSTSQHFPLKQQNDDEGGTPGRPGMDYPVLTTIPPTSFDCKTQRYKGFFADPETRCQVWHYCDLNGGQASFLCPNGTIFSQAGLTCDWWFNVRCASTTQLYVLNESLYKYILPHSPKFPEDYSGPLVDKYLTLKFKEMEEQFKKNKNKQIAVEKVDSDEETNPEGKVQSTEDEETTAPEDTYMTSVSEASVVVGSPGNSGNVERLHD